MCWNLKAYYYFYAWLHLQLNKFGFVIDNFMICTVTRLWHTMMLWCAIITINITNQSRLQDLYINTRLVSTFFIKNRLHCLDFCKVLYLYACLVILMDWYHSWLFPSCLLLLVSQRLCKWNFNLIIKFFTITNRKPAIELDWIYNLIRITQHYLQIWSNK